jgi:hypothetical protein
MKKQLHRIQGICCAMIFLLVCSAFIPSGDAQIITSQTNREKTSQDSPVEKMRYINNDEEDFFDFAIIWGTFEERVDYFPLFSLIVRNPYPWYNRTMFVIGYWIPEHQWFFKKSCQVECGFLHIGIVGFHRLFVVAYGNIAAF